MTVRRVAGGKRIDRHEVRSADGRTLTVDVYLVKARPRAGEPTKFRAICDDADIDVEGPDLDAVAKEAKELAKARADVRWEPHLWIEVQGVRPPETKRDEKDDDGKVALSDLFAAQSWNREIRACFGLEIEVKAVQLATIGGLEKWRYTPDPKENHEYREIRSGRPETGRERPDYYSRRRNMRALVPDTAENRTALVAIRYGLADLVGKLDALFEPARAAATLASVRDFAGLYPPILQLPPPEEGPRPRRRRSGS